MVHRDKRFASYSIRVFSRDEGGSRTSDPPLDILMPCLLCQCGESTGRLKTLHSIYATAEFRLESISITPPVRMGFHVVPKRLEASQSCCRKPAAPCTTFSVHQTHVDVRAQPKAKQAKSVQTHGPFFLFLVVFSASSFLVGPNIYRDHIKQYSALSRFLIPPALMPPLLAQYNTDDLFAK